MKLSEGSIVKKISLTTLLFYILIGFEFIYMASPFAVYFYSVYRPGLSFLDNPAVSWVTGFFLPHLVEDTKSPFINLLKPAGAVLAVSGFLIFLLCAFQVYYSKLFKKGIVIGGLYKYIRHPQYAAFALCGLGMLILWPRYLVLIMYISLLFVYYLLAKAEEKQCEKKFGDSYYKYKSSTGMFIPFKFSRVIKLNIPKTNTAAKAMIIAGLYLITIFISVQLADVLKKISAESLYSLNLENQIFISVFKMEKPGLEKTAKLINTITFADSISKERNIKFIIYVLPAGMYMSEIPMIKPVNAPNHVFVKKYNLNELKLIITKAVMENNLVNDSREVLCSTLSIEPVAEVHITKNDGNIISFKKLNSSTSRYKNIPEPVF